MGTAGRPPARAHEWGWNVSATMIGVKNSAQARRALSSTGISTTIPRRRSGASAATERVTLAPSDVPPTTAA